MQIGENIKSLPPEMTKKYPDVHWRGIAGMRDVIAHGYEGIDLARIWYAITDDIPVLRDACEKILIELRS